MYRLAVDSACFLTKDRLLDASGLPYWRFYRQAFTLEKRQYDWLSTSKRSVPEHIHFVTGDSQCPEEE